MSENRYRQFKDNRWYCTCGKRGSNQTVVLHMWQNVSPKSSIRQLKQTLPRIVKLKLQSWWRRRNQNQQCRRTKPKKKYSSHIYFQAQLYLMSFVRPLHIAEVEQRLPKRDSNTTKGEWSYCRAKTFQHPSFNLKFLKCILLRKKLHS